MDIGLSTLVWVLIILVVIYYWKNIVNLIGGLIWLFVFIFVAIFLILNFTNVPIDNYVPTFYKEIRKGNTDYLVEKKDTAFDKAIETKDKINDLDKGVGSEEVEITEDNTNEDSKEDLNNEDFNKEDSNKTKSDTKQNKAIITTIEESDLNFSDESKSSNNKSNEESNKNNKDKEGLNNEDSKLNKGEEIVPYKDVPKYLEESSFGKSLDDTTKNLVLNLSPYVKWHYETEDYYIESQKEGVYIQVK